MRRHARDPSGQSDLIFQVSPFGAEMAVCVRACVLFRERVCGVCACVRVGGAAKSLGEKRVAVDGVGGLSGGGALSRLWMKITSSTK